MLNQTVVEVQGSEKGDLIERVEALFSALFEEIPTDKVTVRITGQCKSNSQAPPIRIVGLDENHGYILAKVRPHSSDVCRNVSIILSDPRGHLDQIREVSERVVWDGKQWAIRPPQSNKEEIPLVFLHREDQEEVAPREEKPAKEGRGEQVVAFELALESMEKRGVRIFKLGELRDEIGAILSGEINSRWLTTLIAQQIEMGRIERVKKGSYSFASGYRDEGSKIPHVSKPTSRNADRAKFREILGQQMPEKVPFARERVAEVLEHNQLEVPLWTLSRWLKRAVEEGFLLRHGRGRYLLPPKAEVASLSVIATEEIHEKEEPATPTIERIREIVLFCYEQKVRGGCPPTIGLVGLIQLIRLHFEEHGEACPDQTWLTNAVTGICESLVEEEALVKSAKSPLPSWTRVYSVEEKNSLRPNTSDGSITLGDIRGRILELEEKLKSLDTQISTLQEERKKIEGEQRVAEDALETIQRYLALYSS